METYLSIALAVALIALALNTTITLRFGKRASTPIEPDPIASVIGEFKESATFIRYTYDGRPIFIRANLVEFATTGKKNELCLMYRNRGEQDAEVFITDPAEIDAALATLGLTREEVFTANTTAHG